jgi:hypothetical protein
MVARDFLLTVMVRSYRLDQPLLAIINTSSRDLSYVFQQGREITLMLITTLKWAHRANQVTNIISMRLLN